jgi:hypothetical protein
MKSKKGFLGKLFSLGGRGLRHVVKKGVHHGHKHRVRLVPVYVGIVMWLLASVLYLVPQGWKTAFLPVGLTALVLFLYGRHRRGEKPARPIPTRHHLYLWVCWAGASAWFILAALWGPLTHLFSGVLLIGVLASGVPYWWHRFARAHYQPAPAPVAEKVVEKDTVEPEIALWVKKVQKDGGAVPGTELDGFERLENGNGWESPLKFTDDKVGIEEAFAQQVRLSRIYDVPLPNIVLRPAPDGRPTRGHITVLQRNPLAIPTLWAGPSMTEDGTCRIGVHPDGREARIRLWRPDSGAVHMLMAGCTDSGKALALDTPVPTPNGWTTMGELAVGDQVFDEHGQPTQVIAATEVMMDRPCYEVEFSDGTVIVADAKHQWVTTTHQGRRQQKPRRATFRDSPEARALVSDVTTSVLAQPDRLVCVQDVVDLVGKRFEARIRTIMDRLPSAPKAVERSRTQTRAGCTYTHVQRYAGCSAHAVYKELDLRVSADRGAHRVAPADTGPITTEHIAATLHPTGDAGRVNHAIELCGALEYAEKDLPVAPYTLGAWLGDGDSRDPSLTAFDPEVLDRVRVDGYLIKGRSEVGHYGIVIEGTEHAKDGSSMTAIMRKLGVLSNKHIPDIYLQSSVEQRRALLAGLLDTDGYCSVHGVVEFAVTDPRLAHDALELVLGLGYKATFREKPVPMGRPGRTVAYTVEFTAPEPVFGLSRKAVRQRPMKRQARSQRRYIVDVRSIPSVPVRCIQVNAVSSLYLASRSCIPTHNSRLTDLLLAEERHSTLVSSFVIDPQGGQSLPAWRDAVAEFATDAAEGRDLLEHAVDIMFCRNKVLSKEVWYDAKGRERVGKDFFEPTPERPLISITVDEAQAILADPRAIKAAEQLAGMARKCGLALRLITQLPLLAQLGNSMYLRGQVAAGNVIVLRTAERLSGQVAFNGALPGADPAMLPRVWPDGSTTAGLGYLLGASAHQSMYRTDFLNRENVYDWVVSGETTYVDAASRPQPEAPRLHAVPNNPEPPSGDQPWQSGRARERILAYLASSETVRRTTVIAAACGIDKSTASNMLRVLVGEGLVRDHGRGDWSHIDLAFQSASY